MKKETNNLPVKIEEQIQTSGMENLSRAQEIAINYAPYLQQVDEQAEIVKGLKKGNPEHVAIAKRARLDLGKICSAVGERKAEDKQTILIAGKFIDGLYNVVNGAGRLTQGEAKEIEDHAEMLLKAKKDKLRIKREKEISEFDVNPGTGDIADMSDKVWGYYIDGLNNDRDIRIEAEKKVEDERIEALQREDLFTSRKEKLIQFSQFGIYEKLTIDTSEKEFIAIVEEGEKAKIDFDIQQEEIKAENERLKKEAELKKARDEKAEIERQRLAKIEQDKRDKIDRDRQSKVKEEREKLEKIQKDGVENRRMSAVDFLKENDFVNCDGGMSAKKYPHFIGSLHYSELDTDKEFDLFKKDVISTKEKEGQKVQLQNALEEKKSRDEKAEKERQRLAKIEQDKRDKIKSELDAKRKAELAPDREKLKIWLSNMTIDGSLDDHLCKESIVIASEIIDKFNAFKIWATKKVNEIK